ncbi:transglutaminase-like domain-containing protein [Xanthobacter tagetidis]|jgi:transglutaminase-like putative cysteine protease|uniref:Transglutaminase family protein n=1 Tax=Xanthobacter tagetidis TaxID=60216 RepID=A0A3L7AN24_9HYPH|nr:transglutaminase family protein [Xanthobacter tagetidis]MBB6307432.1 transglutaminase-like putative cysteine protease [Xanthobacter tagetidis]RLP81021.1 transglutaminase family protein [Xanthobacter tagetidis]
MLIRSGYEIAYSCPQPTPMILTLSVHPSRINDLMQPDRAVFDPPVAANTYHDSFGNFCHVIQAPPGKLTMRTDFVIRDSGLPDPVAPDAAQLALGDLPVDTLLFLLGSRYCETDRLTAIAWSMFGKTPKGWPLVQAICDFVHGHIAFDYAHASPLKTAFDAYTERQGVCRDFAHLAITLCRCMNIPARYCTGYLGDIGVPADPAPMDFSAWFEAYLGGRWYTFDARHNTPRIGRILMARGRDATDVALVTSFGPSTLAGFKVTTVEASG